MVSEQQITAAITDLNNKFEELNRRIGIQESIEATYPTPTTAQKVAGLEGFMQGMQTVQMQIAKIEERIQHVEHNRSDGGKAGLEKCSMARIIKAFHPLPQKKKRLKELQEISINT